MRGREIIRMLEERGVREKLALVFAAETGPA